MNEACDIQTQSPGLTAVKPDIREGLVMRKNRLEQQLADLDAAITALDENPQVARLLELVGKASRH